MESFELYDLASDPDERIDLSAENPELTRQMQDQARDWLETCRESAFETGEAVELDDMVKEQLRALGYVY